MAEKEEEDEELNPAAKLALRSLDIVFFLVEKVMITGIPLASQATIDVE